MRIGLLIYGDLNIISGGYLYDRRLVDHLRAQGDSVEIVSLPWRSYGHHLLDNFKTEVREKLARLRVDVLIQDELNHPSLFHINSVLRDAPFPVISLVHHLRSSEEHPRLLRSLYRAVERRYLASVDGFICNSHTTRAAVRSLLGQGAGNVADDSWVVAYPAADHLEPPAAEDVQRLIEKRRHRTGLNELLFVGNLIPRKGAHHLLAALTRISHPYWRLHIVGRADMDPAYSARLHAHIRRNGLGERVRFHGQVSDAALRDLLGRVHLLAVPSYEGFGIVYLEAMAFGLPVIASTAGAAREIVTPGVNGFTVDPSDRPAFVQTLRGCLESSEALAAMGAAAREVYERHPTWADTGARIRDFLMQQMSRQR